MGKSLQHVFLLTDSRYVNPVAQDAYTANILAEDRLLGAALERRGISFERVDWARSDIEWSSASAALFRTTWDYFRRIEEFSRWLDRVAPLTRLINPPGMIRWNMDKHYLADLAARGVHTVPTCFLRRGTRVALADLLEDRGWEEAVLKPAVSGAARHTYRVDRSSAAQYEQRLARLLGDEDMLLQPFQRHILDRGEIALVMIAGTVTHGVKKIARSGDFRVQDDHGGTVHPWRVSAEEQALAECALAACDTVPLYGRVDLVLDNDDRLAVMELELIEPELWLRMHPAAADLLADGLATELSRP